MGIKQLYNDNLRKLPNKYRDVSVMLNKCGTVLALVMGIGWIFIIDHQFMNNYQI